MGLGALLLAGAQTAERRERAERRALVTLSALAAVVDRASGGSVQEAAPAAPRRNTCPKGGMGLGAEIAAAEQGQAQAPTDDEAGAIRKAVEGFAAAHPEVAAIRVVEFEGIMLAASTAAADQGAKAAPRRLERDEKPLYDLGQKLRAAVESNRQGAEGAARAPELGFERRPDGVLALAAPVERGGEVIGMVQMETRAVPEPATFIRLPFLVFWLAPVIAMVLLSLRPRRTAVAAGGGRGPPADPLPLLLRTLRARRAESRAPDLGPVRWPPRSARSRRRRRRSWRSWRSRPASRWRRRSGTSTSTASRAG